MRGGRKGKDRARARASASASGGGRGRVLVVGRLTLRAPPSAYLLLTTHLARAALGLLTTHYSLLTLRAPPSALSKILACSSEGNNEYTGSTQMAGTW